jgi:hypothetical protein
MKDLCRTCKHNWHGMEAKRMFQTVKSNGCSVGNFEHEAYQINRKLSASFTDIQWNPDGTLFWFSRLTCQRLDLLA